MRRTKFTNLRLLLKYANELFDDGKISENEFIELVAMVENDYNRIVTEMDNLDTSDTLLAFINKSK